MSDFNNQGFTAYGLSLMNGTQGFTQAGMQHLTGTVGRTSYGVELTTGVPQFGGNRLLQQQTLYNQQQQDRFTSTYPSYLKTHFK